MLKNIIVIVFVSLLCSNNAFAIQESRPLPYDSRLRVITYHPQGIHKYVGFFNYQASIIFDVGETVKTISMGFPDGWQITPAGRRLFLKPVSDDPEETNTNMLLITEKEVGDKKLNRIYHFILEAEEVNEEGINDPNLVFETRFLYPDTEGEVIKSYKKNKVKNDLDLIENPEKYNFNYTISGSDYIAPIKIFDDGEFTYFQFSKTSPEIPAFFLVTSEGRESLINYRIEGDYLVVERLASRFTLRHGPDVVCVFNETRPHIMAKGS